jgi:hypothetical protein
MNKNTLQTILEWLREAAGLPFSFRLKDSYLMIGSCKREIDFTG